MGEHRIVIHYQTAAPITTLFTAADMREYIRIDDSAEAQNTLIDKLIDAARQKIEHDTGRLLLAQTWEVGLMYWPRQDYIQLPNMPATAISGFTYVTGAGTQTYSNTNYALNNQDRSQRATVVRKAAAWPTDTLVYPGIRITYTCGYTTVPTPLQQAARMLITHWYENREAVLASTIYKAEAAEIPLGYAELISDYKLH